MSTLSIASDRQFDQHSYLRNLGKATAALLSALFAVAPRRRSGDWSREEVYAYAKSCESSMPNLATELRFIASRG